MISLYQMLKDLLSWSWANKRTAFEIVLGLALAFTGWRYHHDKAKLEADKLQAQGLAAGLQEQVTVANNELEVVKRDANGKVTVKEVYVPPEGSVVISQKEKDALQKQVYDLNLRLQQANSTGNSIEAAKIQSEIDSIDPDLGIKVDSWGFTFRPGFGLDAGQKGIQPRGDFKWFYWHRWSAIAGGSPNGLGVGLSRHIDDIVWKKAKNVEPFIQYNPIIAESGHQITGGIRVNF